MAWFRLEGRGAFHYKVLAAGNEAYGAWCRAGQWSSDQLTDGAVPFAAAEQIAKADVWEKLVAARLIEATADGYQIHDFLDWNPSSEDERARRDAMREKRRESGRIGGKRSGEVRRGEAEPKQTGSNHEANAKQSASPGASVLLEANAKQNEAPSPSPSPSPSISEPPLAPAPARDESPVLVMAVPEKAPPAPPGPPPEGWAEIASADVLLRAVSKHPMLATLHGDRRWASDASGGLQARACRAEDAAAAVDAFVTGESGKAPDDGDALAKWVREKIGGYLKKAKQYGDEERRRSRDRPVKPSAAGFAPSPEPPNGGALSAFCGPWAAAQGRAYLPAPSAAVKAERLAEQLREQGIDPAGAIRRAAEQYLADDADVLAGANHPFALFLTRVNQYDVASDPPAASTPRPLPEPPPPRPVRRMTPEQQQAFQDGLMERLRAEEKAKAG